MLVMELNLNKLGWLQNLQTRVVDKRVKLNADVVPVETVMLMDAVTDCQFQWSGCGEETPSFP